MQKLIPAMAICLAMAATYSAASAAPENHQPQCPAKTIVMRNLPGNVDLSAIEIDPIAVAPVCTDADGDPLTLISTSTEASVNAKGKAATKGRLKAGESVVITYTVSDGKGGTATSTLTIKRD